MTQTNEPPENPGRFISKIKQSIALLGLKPIDALRQRVISFEHIEKIIFHEGAWEIHVTYKPHHELCPACGEPAAILYWYQSTFLDAPLDLDSKIVRLLVRRPSYICNACKRSHTTLIPGVVKGLRVTQRLRDYVLQHIWCADSLRSLADSIGASPKVISKIILRFADEARDAMVIPTEIGIHQIMFSGKHYLIISNLANGSIVDFFHFVDDKMTLFIQRLIDFSNHAPVRLVVVPADIRLIRLVASSCRPSKIEISIDSIYSLIADNVVNLLIEGSKKGKRGSVSKNEARRLSLLRRTDLSSEETELFEAGLLENNRVCKLFDANERLLISLENSDSTDWLNIFRAWLLNLPQQWQHGFLDVLILLRDANEMQASIKFNRAQHFIDRAISDLEMRLLKSGKSYSPELVAALILATPSIWFFPVSDLIKSKGREYFWLDKIWGILATLSPPDK